SDPSFSPAPLLSARFDLTNDDRQVRKRLDNAARAPTRTGMETFHHQRLADMGFGDYQIVDVEVVVVLGIGNCRLQALPDVTGDPLARKLQDRKSTRLNSSH